jgi:hypothetical protein
MVTASSHRQSRLLSALEGINVGASSGTQLWSIPAAPLVPATLNPGATMTLSARSCPLDKSLANDWARQQPTTNTEHTVLIRQAMAYVIELYRELSQENGAPTLGTQNQAVDFIVADPELSQAVSDWARTVEVDEATTKSSPHLPYNGTYQRIRAYLLTVTDEPVFTRAGQTPGDRREFSSLRIDKKHIHSSSCPPVGRESPAVPSGIWLELSRA